MDEAILLDEAPDDEITEPGNASPFVLEIPPSLLTEQNEARLRSFLDDELTLAESEMHDMISDIAAYEEAYEAPPPDTPKNFPIRNASNTIVPVVKEVVNTIVAQLVQTTRTTEPEWILKDLAEEWSPFTNGIERFLNISAERELGLEETEITAIIEEVKYGTAIVEVPYDVRERLQYQYTLDGKSVFPRIIVDHEGPDSMNVPISDWRIREYETNIQKAKWCAKRVFLTDDDLRERVASGRFLNDQVRKILEDGGDQTSDIVADVQRNAEHTSRHENKRHEVFEVYVRWSLEGQHLPTDLHIFYHRGTGTFLSKRFNPYWHGLRPFVRYVYFPRQHRFWGQGVISQIVQLQAEISTIHNQRRDNATLANLKMIVKRKMVRGIMPGDPLYSGKVIEVNDIFNDIREFQLSEIYPSTVTDEQVTRQYVERVSGVSEPRNSPVTRTTATAQLALLQEQAKKFDLTVRGNRKAKGEIGRMLVGLYSQFGTNGKAVAWMGEQGRVIEAVFRLPRKVTELGLAIRASAPTSQLNKETKRQNSLALFNLMVQMYSQFIPFVQQLTPEALPGVAHALVTSAKKFMLDALASFDVTDPDEMLAGLALMERILPNPEDFGGMESFRRAEEGTAQLEALGRLEAIIRETANTQDRSGGLRESRRNTRGLESTEGLPPGRLPGSRPTR